jgi:hypothetical protein
MAKLRNSATRARQLALITAMLVLSSSSANAVQAPSDQCRAVSKIEYDMPKDNFCCVTDLALMSEPDAYGAAIFGIVSYRLEH